MADPKLVDELAQRAGVSRADAEAVVEALGGFAPERVLALLHRPPPGPGPAPSPYVPAAREVGALIAEAQKHPLGLEFLLSGDLSAVAITFQVHAFTVDAARQQLKGHAR
jgi:hypothetical protein